ncbi:Retrovirus-related Pol polyprotein from transposon 297-like Protein [Tribolium castaneum]|uniref:RNA-directed DNA polymerase n=1 Tax=Tribolium castaneum TaxID=7070 RepID=A0A139W8Z5_TRICA|nr:Retrovirus-related Pol polyprotein from transposon 297-like Protein [Tribolium castaneum]
MPTPKSVKEVQRFLGMCNYYRKFIKNFSAIARPLHEVTKRKLKFEWIHGRHVKIVTDHSAIRWLKSIKDPTGKLARWAIKLSEFQYTVVHRSGSKHKDADCLSRNPVAEGNEADEVDCEEIPTYLVKPDELRQLQLEDDELKELITAVENDNDTNIPIGTRRRAKNFSLIDGVLYKKNTREGKSYITTTVIH